MKRHQLLAGLVALCIALAVSAQSVPKMHRVGFIATISPLAEISGSDPVNPFARAFVHGLRAQGYIDGKNLQLEMRSLEGKPERLEGFVADLARLGVQAAQPLLAQAAGSRVTVSVEAESPVAEVLCDTAQLDTALVNLVVDARDAMAGSGRIAVRVYPCADDAGVPRASVAGAPFVCVSVQDSGPGMSEEVRRRAVEPFYTTKGEAGTGLGLPQVYGFMQQIGGSMTIESPAGGGAAIHLFFPVAATQAADEP